MRTSEEYVRLALVLARRPRELARVKVGAGVWLVCVEGGTRAHACHGVCVCVMCVCWGVFV